MAARGRKKALPPRQNNTLLSYLSKSQTDSQGLCRQIVEDLISCVTVRSEEIATGILDEILCGVVKPKKHAADAVSHKTLTDWGNKYPWLEIDHCNSTMKCKTCTNVKTSLKLTSVWANEGTPNFQASALSRHNNSTEHTQASVAYEKQHKTKNICSEIQEDETSSVTVTDADKMIFNTVYMAAKTESPSSVINSMITLQSKNGLDMKYTNLSWDTITDMQSSIAHVLQADLVSDIKASGVFALMLDESTDVTIDKRLSICVRYVKDGEPQTKMLCNVHLDDGCAHTIVNCVSEQFKTFGVDLDSCTSLATDGAAVMLGRHKGVGKQLVSKYSPYCVQTHCMAHRVNLACTDSIKKNEYMIKFRDMFTALYNFVSGSSIRTQRLRSIQQLLQEPELSMKEPYSIRWLGLRNAVLAVFEAFESVLATLSSFASEKNPVAKGLFKYFCSYKVALVLAFILDVHNELAVLSCGLQKSNILFSEVKPLMDATSSKLTYYETNDGECLSKMKNMITRTDDGVKFGEEKLKFHENMDKEFEDVRSDYIKRLKKNIKERFRKEDSAIFDDFGRVFEPSQVNTSSQTELKTAVESLSSFYGYEKSVKIVDGNLTDGTQETTRVIAPLIDPKKLEEEWPRYEGMIRGAYAKLSVDRICKRIIVLHDDVMPNVSKLASMALCLQPTSVECERTFSTQNRLKCKYRASLGTEKLNILMTISMLGPSLSDYDAAAAVSHWLSQKKRRRVRLYAGYKPRDAKKAKLSVCDL